MPAGRANRRLRRGEAPAAGSGEPGANRERLYARSVDKRRIMFLELVASAVAVTENLPDEAAFRRFEERLKQARLDNGWGVMPWVKAPHPKEFPKHVARLAEGSTTRGGEYVGRTVD